MVNGETQPGPLTWSVELTPTAIQMLTDIKDVRERKKIAEAIDGLSVEPAKQGKELAATLEGYRSIRAAGQRYRIVYQVQEDKVIVLVVAVGRRQDGSTRDIYKLAQRLVRLAMQEPEAGDENTDDGVGTAAEVQEE